jgi:antitoxin HicB
MNGQKREPDPAGGAEEAAHAERGAPHAEAETALAGFSGKFIVRIPRSLHRDLVRRAAEEGVSLNQFATVALARAVGWSAPRKS